MTSATAGTAPVRCDSWREAISAAADGEPVQLDDRLVAAHLRRCPSCRAYAEVVALTTGSQRRPAAPTTSADDLTATVVAQARRADRAGWSVARALLGVVAVEVLVFAVVELVRTGDDAHDARHLGAFAVAYGVGLLGVVWRPARARAMLPVAAVLAVALAITAVVDIVAGDVPLAGEALHLAELVSVGLVWWMAVPSHRDLGRVAARLRRRRPRG